MQRRWGLRGLAVQSTWFETSLNSTAAIGQFETVASPNGNLLSALSGPQLVSLDGSRYP